MKTKKPMGWFLDKLKPFRHFLFLNIFCSLIITAIDLWGAYFVKLFIEYALAKKMDMILNLSFTLAIIVILNFLFRFLAAYTSSKLGSRVVRDIRKNIFKSLSQISISALDNSHSGDILSHLNNDIPVFKNFFQNALINMVYQPFIFIGSLIFMFLLNWKLSLFCIAIIPICLFLVVLVSNPIGSLSKKLQKSLAELNAMIQDSLGGIQVIRTFNLAELFLNRFKKISDRSLKKSLKIEKRRAVLTPISQVLQLVPMLLCLLFGGYLVYKNEMPAGDLGAIFQLILYLTPPLIVLPKNFATFQKILGVAHRFIEFDKNPRERSGGAGLKNSNQKTVIEFDNISFSYTDEKPLFRNLSFNAETHKHYALVGKSGSGKTTLFQLLCGFYDCSEGRINLFGNDITHTGLKELRSKISLVTQAPVLFPVSIAENISYGKPDSTLKEIEKAAQIASAHDFISELPLQYNTILGERGVRISGGQKQRIALARAILKNAPVLLLDEPTSALDMESENLVQYALDKFSRDRTVITIAHRLSTIKNADMIIVLDKGQIVATGSHSDLLKNSPLYTNLYQSQFAKE